MAKKHPTNIHFDHDLWEWLKQESQRRRASIGQIVRELVAREMDAQKARK
jgi:hypothetical protein